MSDLVQTVDNYNSSVDEGFFLSNIILFHGKNFTRPLLNSPLPRYNLARLHKSHKDFTNISIPQNTILHQPPPCHSVSV